MAFDLYSAEMVLDALGGREDFGFTFDPSPGLTPLSRMRLTLRPDRPMAMMVRRRAAGER